MKKLSLWITVENKDGETHRIVPICAQGKDLAEITPEKLWQMFVAAQESLNKSLK